MKKKIVLKSLFAAGFRGFETGRSFEFEKGKTFFIGDNGEGKSSIGEAVVWAFTGMNMAGATKNLNVKNQNSSVAQVIVEFEDETGKVNELERKLNSSLTIKLNGETVKQSDLEEEFPAKLLLTLFNPMYFLQMDAPSARKRVYSMLKHVKKEEILSRMDERAQEALGNELFEVDSTNAYLANRAEEATKKEQESQALIGYLAKAKETIKVPEKLVFAKKETLESKKKELEEKLVKAPIRQEGLSDAMKELVEKRKQIENAHKDAGAKMAEARISERTSQLEKKAMIEKEIVRIEQSKFVPLANDLISKRDVFRMTYQMKEEEVNRLKATLTDESVPLTLTCATCAQELPKDKKKELEDKQTEKVRGIKEVARVALKELSDILEEGKKLTASIKEMEGKNKLEEEKFQKNKENELKELREKLKELDARLEKIATEESSQQKELEVHFEAIRQEGLKIAAKDKADKLKVEELIKTHEAAVLEIRKEIKLLEEEEKIIEKNNTASDVLAETEKKRLEDVTKIEARMEELEKEVLQIQEKVFYMKQFVVTKVQMMHEELEKHLFRVTIRLQRTTESTGELKDCFDIFYDKKPVAICSLSEQIRAGLELVGMISATEEISYPVFLDNAESITSYQTAAEQIIEVQVSKGKKLSLVSQGKEDVIKGSALPRRSQQVVEV